MRSVVNKHGLYKPVFCTLVWCLGVPEDELVLFAVEGEAIVPACIMRLPTWTQPT